MACSYLRLTAAGNLTRNGVGGATELVAVNVNTAASAAGSVTILDGTTSTGTSVAVIDTSAKGSYFYDGIRLVNGLYAVFAGTAADVTISYR